MKSLRKFVVPISLVAVVLIAASPWLLYRYRTSQFASICTLVSQHGGSLSFDLQGDYSLQFDNGAVDNETLNHLLPHLRTLPTGFTFIGPGEGRHFYVRIENTQISADGMHSLCSLSISCIVMNNCPSIGDDCVDALLTLHNPYAIIDGNVAISEDAIRKLRTRMPNAFPNRGG